jgi:hypothetical protein
VSSGGLQMRLLTRQVAEGIKLLITDADAMMLA